MAQFADRRPLPFVALVLLVLQAIVVAALALSHALDVPLLALDLPVLLLNALVAIALLSVLRWWRAAGFVGPRRWRNLHLLWVPAALLLVPTLVLRPTLPPLEQLAMLSVAALLIGFQEEAIFRGIMLRALAGRGVVNATVIAAIAFGAIHANSFLVGRDPAFVVAQIVASTLGAVGLCALWFRLGTIWPLIALHAVNDVLQFSTAGGLEAQAVAGYLPVVKIVVSGLMAAYGVLLLRAELRERGRSDPAHDTRTARSAA